MATVTAFPFRDLNLRKARRDSGLSLTQAASALGISTATLESWEGGKKSQVDPAFAASTYNDYVVNTKAAEHCGKNVLFGCFPMRVARDILELEIEEIASEFNFSASSWRKIEANSRFAPDCVIVELERRIGLRMSDLCAFQY